MNAFCLHQLLPPCRRGEKGGSAEPIGWADSPAAWPARSFGGGTKARGGDEVIRSGRCGMRGQRRAESGQGQWSPAARWQVSSVVKASAGILGRLFLMPDLGWASDLSVSGEAWVSRLPISSGGGGVLYTCKDIFVFVCKSTSVNCVQQPSTLTGAQF